MVREAAEAILRKQWPPITCQEPYYTSITTVVLLTSSMTYDYSALELQAAIVWPIFMSRRFCRVHARHSQHCAQQHKKTIILAGQSEGLGCCKTY